MEDIRVEREIRKTKKEMNGSSIGRFREKRTQKPERDYFYTDVDESLNKKK